MKLIYDRDSLRKWVRKKHQDGERIGLAPTMGNLHAGHLRLLDVLRPHSDCRIVSIFVNPTQFGPNEDFDRYPRTLERDLEQLSATGCEAVFVPGVEEMYPFGRDPLTRVVVRDLENRLCGAFRPGHFQGVATVVSKLLHLVQPDVACFGEKDWQQLAVIRAMVRDLDMPVDILGCPTEREQDGLAMSSRNQYLSPEERQRAVILYRTLQQSATAIRGGLRDFRMLESSAMGLLQKSGFVMDYFSIVDAETLEPAVDLTQQIRLLAAGRLGQTRLIDNCPVHQLP